MKAKCKYCGVTDDVETMHKDKYTEEYYHDRCRLRKNNKEGK